MSDYKRVWRRWVRKAKNKKSEVLKFNASNVGLVANKLLKQYDEINDESSSSYSDSNTIIYYKYENINRRRNNKKYYEYKSMLLKIDKQFQEVMKN